MNREEAQFILQSYRPNSADAHDPQFKEALSLVRQDPELALWFTAEQAMDRAFVAKLRAGIPAAPDLKTQLHIARTTTNRVRWWRAPAWLAAAAAIALLFSLGAWLLHQKAGEAHFTDFRALTAQAVFDMSHHIDVMGLDDPQLKQWLTEHRGAADFVLPPKLAEKGVMGCRVMDWRGHNVTLLCFKFAGKHADVFVVDESALAGLSLSTVPLYASSDALTTATWRSGGKIYHLAGNLSKSDIEQLL